VSFWGLFRNWVVSFELVLNPESEIYMNFCLFLWSAFLEKPVGRFLWSKVVFELVRDWGIDELDSVLSLVASDSVCSAREEKYDGHLTTWASQRGHASRTASKDSSNRRGEKTSLKKEAERERLIIWPKRPKSNRNQRLKRSVRLKTFSGSVF
jgi:hypothetical protein